jgi:ATP-binding cassette subfamily B protein
MLLELGLQLGQRKAFSALIDDAILQGQVPLMVLILGLLFAAAVISSLCGSAHEYLLSGLCAVIPAEARDRLFHHVQGMPLGQLRSAAHGDLVSRIVNDAGGLESALWSIGFVATSFFGVAIALAMLLSTDWRLALLGLALLLPTIPIGPRLLTPLAERASYASKEAHGQLSAQLWENLANQVVIRVFGMSGFVRSRFAQVNAEINRFTRSYNLYSYFSNRVPWIAVELIEVIVLAAGCWMLVRGHITTGALVSFYLLFSALATHAYSFASSFTRLAGVSASMRRIQALHDEALDNRLQQNNAGTIGPQKPRRPPRIRFEAVSFRYPRFQGLSGDRPAISRPDENDATRGSPPDPIIAMTLDIADGQLTAFVGASGSGKSTAVQLLLGLHQPSSGRILVDGADLRTLPLEGYWSSTSAVFQDSLLFHASIAENIRAAHPAASNAQVEHAARSAGLAKWIESLPEGYHTRVSADTCSGGQRQRIAIARALVRDPVLLVLDEPSSALDASTGRAVIETLLQVMAQRTTVLVTHQLRDATRADCIVVFEHGRVAEAGRHDELLALNGVYRALWTEQEHRLQASGMRCGESTG